MILILRLLHIVLGACWVGAVVAFALFVEPAIRAAGAAGSAVMMQIVARKFSQAMAATAGLTVLTGFLLFWHDARTGGPSWPSTPVGMGFSVGGVAALSAMLVGLFMMRPTIEKIGKLMTAAAGGPPSAEVIALMAKAHKGGRIVAALLLIAVAAMSVARYL